MGSRGMGEWGIEMKKRREKSATTIYWQRHPYAEYPYVWARQFMFAKLSFTL